MTNPLRDATETPAAAEERALSGPLLRALYPLGTAVPGLDRVPLPVRKVVRRTLTSAAVRAHLARCRELELVAVTGSRGKTTTKDLIGAMLATAGPTLKTRKNDNGLYGVPATLLAIRPGDRYAVIEAGIYSTPGEMGWMSSLFEPAVAVLTSIGEDHTTHYGSTAAVAAEKRSLLERVPAGGSIVVYADDPLARRTCKGLAASIVTAGTAPDSDFRLVSAEPAWPEGTRLRIDAAGREVACTVALFGTHLAPAVAVAMAAAAALGVEPADALAGLATFAPPDGRLSPRPGPGGAIWLLDDFKSRIPGQRAAIQTLGEIRGARRIAVLGEVQEGALERGWASAAELLPGKAEVVIAVGRGAADLRDRLAGSGIEASAHSGVEAAAAALAAAAGEDDVILLHGATQQHLRRIKVLLEEGALGCRVARCRLHWLCEDCPYLQSRPPDRIVVER